MAALAGKRWRFFSNEYPPYVKKFMGRVMGTRERVAVLAPGVDPFFKAVFVFTSAWVDAKFSIRWRTKSDHTPDQRGFAFVGPTSGDPF